MRPVCELTRSEAQRLHGLLFDMDDTLLDRGELRPEALSALYQLRDSGLKLMVVTGRPASWGCVLVRQWPVFAAVMENGAVGVCREGRTTRFLDSVDPAARRHRRERVRQLGLELQRRFPELHCADEYDARISDYALDIGETHQVDAEVVSAAVALARERGFRTSCSSVHLHVTLDPDDKASGAIRVLRSLLGIDPTAARERFAFIGDSGNDAACFAAFRTTIAPRNLSGRPTIGPRFIATEARAAGFAEAAHAILQARSST